MISNMACPKTAGPLWEMIVKKFGTNEVSDLEPMTGVDRKVLELWRDKPNTKTTKPARVHYAYIFEGIPRPAPSRPASSTAPDLSAEITAMRAEVAEIRTMLADLARAGPPAGRRRKMGV